MARLGESCPGAARSSQEQLAKLAHVGSCWFMLVGLWSGQCGSLEDINLHRYLVCGSCFALVAVGGDAVAQSCLISLSLSLYFSHYIVYIHICVQEMVGPHYIIIYIYNYMAIAIAHSYVFSKSGVSIQPCPWSPVIVN